ncbi:MAG: nuclear transport factor 2 family protein [Coraliomargaritaceae bacterium]
MHTQTVPDTTYKNALEWTDPSYFELPDAGSDEETTMIRSVEALFSDYSKENLSKNLTSVYAEKVYFRDAFKYLESADAIREYMLAGLEPLHAVEFVFNKVLRDGGDFYIDWTMRLDFRKTPPGTWEESIGMTRMRFNSEGRIIFHQDYWDPTDIVYRRIPIARSLIALVKKKL